MSRRTGVFYPKFTCRRAANGGWLLQYDGSNGHVTDILGAFTTPGDLIEHLAAHISEKGLEEVSVPSSVPEGGAE